MIDNKYHFEGKDKAGKPIIIDIADLSGYGDYEIMVMRPRWHDIEVSTAETLDEALQLLEERKEGWRVEDLRELEPIVVPLTGAKVVYTHIRGSIDHL